MPTIKEQNIKFVNIIEKYPCLYDHTCEKLSKEKTREKAWRKVAKEFKLTVQDCKKKWKNIYKVFQKFLLSTPSSNSYYYLYQHLQYLTPTSKVKTKIQANRSPSPAPTIIREENNEDSDVIIIENNNEIIDVEIYHPTNSPGTSQSETKFTNHQEIKHNCNLMLNNTRTDSSKTRKRKITDDSTNTDILVKNSATVSDEQFLLSLAEDMKEMSTRQKRKFKRRIFNLIDDILYEQRR